MSSGTPYIGTKISLISKAEIRYEGILYAIDTKNATVTLANVRSFGTEDRQAEKKIPPRDEVYEYIVFRGQDIKDLLVCETPSKQLPQDPAIVQSGNVGLPSGGYSHFHTPVTYPQAPSYSPFSGLPSYSGYPPGIQPPFVDRQIPGHVHPGMVPPGPLLPPRIPTPPPSQPIPLSRSHTPSPETVLPIAPSSIHREAKSDETSVKTTSQQGTQTVQPKRRSSRSSSRRNSEDKTEAVQERKRQEQRTQEAKSADTTVKDVDSSKQSGENQKPRQGSNRRSQGRRGNASARGLKGRTGAVKFDGEFDFESSNAKFRKEEIEEELQQKMTENLRITYEGENAMNSTTNHDVLNDRPQSPVSFYDGSKSFFDSISCEANDRDRNRRAHPSWQQERKVNMETFGMSGGMRRGGRGRGRGRGGYRGGRGGSRPQGRDGSSRGGWRGGRGSRGNRSKPWVDDAVNGDDGLPTRIPNGPSAPGAVGGTVAKA